MYFNTEDQIIQTELSDGIEYHLILGNIRTDTIIGNTLILNNGKCCDTYGVDNVIVNSEIKCNSTCNEILFEL